MKSSHILHSSHNSDILSGAHPKARSNSTLRLNKSSPFKITLNRSNQNEEPIKPSLVVFKNILKAQTKFAPKIQFSHVNSQELLELISHPNKNPLKVESRPSIINTLRQAEESVDKPGSNSQRTFYPSPLASPRQQNNISRFSITHRSWKVDDVRVVNQEPKYVKLRKNKFNKHLQGNFLMGSSSQQSSLLKPEADKSSLVKTSVNWAERGYIEKIGNSTSQSLFQYIMNMKKEDSRENSQGQNEEFSANTKTFLVKRTASIPNLHSNAEVNLAVRLKKCHINSVVFTSNSKLSRPKKNSQSTGKLMNPLPLSTAIPKIMVPASYYKTRATPQKKFIQQANTPAETPQTSFDGSASQLALEEKLRIKNFDALLSEIKEDGEVKTKRNQSNLSVFQVSTVGDQTPLLSSRP